MQEQEFAREARFVAEQVDVFIQRFNNKLDEVTPPICEETILRESGIKGIEKAMDNVERLFNNVQHAIDAHSEAIDAFNDTYGEASDELGQKAVDAVKAEVEEKKRDFEFRIRRAIGLVELVGSEDAFIVLDNCRNEIEALGKE